MEPMELTVALAMDWDKRRASRDTTLAEAESLEEAIAEAVEEHLNAMEDFDVQG